MTRSDQIRAQGALFVAILAIVTFVDLPGDNRLMGELQNTAHTLVFGLLALLALSLIRHTRRLNSMRTLFQYLAAFALCLLAGVAIELIQALTQRDADVWDVLRDGAGIAAFLGVYSSMDTKNTSFDARTTKGRLVVASASIVLMVALMPAAKISYAYIARERAFPLLLDFNSNWYSDFLSTNHAGLTVVAAPPEWWQAAGKLVAKVTLQPGRYPGLELADPHPDWKGFSSFNLNIFSPNAAPFPLIIRINDQQHNFAVTDRFNRRLTIEPGENLVHIPLAAVQSAPLQRQMDMQMIKTIILFAPGLKHKLTFYLRDMRLK